MNIGKKAGMAVAAVLLAQAVLFGQSVSKIDGVVFSDYYYNLQNSVKSEKDRNAFQFRRIYFTFENNITENLKVRFRLESEHGSYSSTSKINPFVKHAYLEWTNLIPSHKLYLGIAETNAFKNSEEYWGYRSVEKTIMDLNKISSSADMGIALKGDLSKTFHHWLTYMNGTGYGASEGDRFKKVGYALWATPVKGLIVEGYADLEYQDSRELQTAAQLSSAKDYTLATQYRTLKGFVGYSRPQFTVGIEAFQRTNVKSGIGNASATYDSSASRYKVSASAPSDIVRFGYSAFFSWITPVPKLKMFARYDFFDSNTGDDIYSKFDEKTGKFTSGTDDENTLLIAGLDYIPAGNLHIMPNIILKNYAKEGLDNDLTARLTLYYKFDSGKITIE
ncbi:hypothetical protein JW906_16055 [bacterium]|nr:hypothetical protein [bacterium]